MRIFALADPHLSHGSDKPMDVFGPRWKDHARKIAEAANATIGRDDLFLIPGDISWAMHLPEGREDFAFLHGLPGKKLLLRGNHDYWWDRRAKVERYFAEEGFDSLSLLQNDARRYEGPGDRDYIFGGTRLWLPPAEWKSASDKKIYSRELDRLALALEAAERLCAQSRAEGRTPYRIAVLHYPPVTKKNPDTPAAERLRAFAPELVIYGHLHGYANRSCIEGAHDGLELMNVAADHIGFRPRRIDPEGRAEAQSRAES